MSLPVLLLVIANLAMYVIVGISGGSWLNIQPAVLAHWGANQGALTIGHEWWRLVTSMFLHGGLVHLVVNMLSLLYLGRVAHFRFGPGAFFLSYFVSGIAGSLLSLAVNANRVSIGASGAIFGLAGALFASTFTRNPDLQEANKRFRTELLKVLGFNLVFGALSPGIDNAAHVGGLIGGVLTGAALAAGGDRDRRPTRQRVATVGAASGVLLVIGGAALARWFAPEPGSYALHKEAVASVLQELRAQDAQQLRAHVLEASLAPLERAVREHPDSVSLTLDLARSLALSGKTDSARRVLQAAATRLPDRADVHLALGALSLNLQQYDDAVAAFSSALRLDPGNPALVHDLGIARLQLATQRLNTGDQSGARRALDEVLSTGIAPESTRARFVIDSLGRQPRD